MARGTGNVEHRQFWGHKQLNIMKCLVGSLSPSKGRQVGEQGKGEGRIVEGMLYFGAADRVFRVLHVTLIEQ